MIVKNCSADSFFEHLHLANLQAAVFSDLMLLIVSQSLILTVMYPTDS